MGLMSRIIQLTSEKKGLLKRAAEARAADLSVETVKIVPPRSNPVEKSTGEPAERGLGSDEPAARAAGGSRIPQTPTDQKKK